MAERWAPAATAGARASMAANQTGRTKPELVLRRSLEDAGMGGFVCNDRSLPGVPDMAFHGQRVAVFMHGCYWHSCPSCYPAGAHGRKVGGANAHLWRAKFVRNDERFASQFAALCEAGWLPLVVWECELRRNGPQWAVDVVRAVIEAAAQKEGTMPVSGGAGGGTGGGGGSVFSCEEQAQISQAAAEAALDAVLNNPNSTLAQKAAAETAFIAAVIALRAAEAYCIAHRKITGFAKPAPVTLDDVVFVLGAIVVIGFIAYVVFSTAPLILIAVAL